MVVNQAGSAIIAVGGYIGAPINDGFVHIGNQIHTIYTEQRTGENIAGSVVMTVAYSIVSVVGLVDLHEAVTGREARSGPNETKYGVRAGQPTRFRKVKKSQAIRRKSTFASCTE